MGSKKNSVFFFIILLPIGAMCTYTDQQPVGSQERPLNSSNNWSSCIIDKSNVSILNNESVSCTNSIGSNLSSNDISTLSHGSQIYENKSKVNSTPTKKSSAATRRSTITDSSLTITNSGVISAGIGCSFVTSSTSIVNSKVSLTNINEIQALDSARGVQIQAGEFSLSDGSITLTNTGNIGALGTSGTGTGIHVGTGNFTLNEGTISLSNSGKITNRSSNSSGSIIAAPNSFIMNGGTLNIHANTGLVSGTNNAGSRVQVNGALTMNGGTLQNDDTVQTPTLTIGSLATLAGKGTFTNLNNAQTTVITNSGTVIPGDARISSASPGVMDINGSYTQTETGNLTANILNPTAYSQLNVLGASLGTAELDGNLQIVLSSGASFAAGDVFTIVKTSKLEGLTGTFVNVSDTIPYLTPHIQYFPDHVELHFSPAIIEFIGNSPQTVLTLINMTNARINRQMMLLRDRFTSPNKQTKLALTTSPDVQTEVASTDFSATKNQMTHSKCNASDLANFYFCPTGNVGKVFANGNQSGYSYWSSGALAGFDYAFSQAGVGILFDYNYIDATTGTLSSFHIHEALASLYVTYSPKNASYFSINGILGGGYNWYQIHRPTAFDQAVGTPNGHEFDALVGMEYALSTKQLSLMPKNLKIIPLASVQFTYIHIDKYKEQNAGKNNFQISSQKIQSLRSNLGTKVNYTWTIDKHNGNPTTIKTEIDAAWQREYLNKNNTYQFTPAAFVQPLTTLIVPDFGRNNILVGIDITTTLRQKYGYEANYNFEWNKNYLNHNFYLGFHYAF
jgi:uncharacterized protein YhjY with autotransporter beta-barrel domain